MAATQRVSITTPVGRIVLGSLYKPNTTDAEGKPLVIKNGPNAGQKRVNYFFAQAIPKNPGETHWAQTEWGKQIWAVGHRDFPQAAQSAAFAWKIEDGDSAQPNKKGRKPCDNEGWAGCWVLKFSGGTAPKVYRDDAGALTQVMEENAVKPGYYVQVRFSVDGNGSQSQPGVYLNHSMVCLRGFGTEIVFGENVEEAGFGAAPLPAGATAMPPAMPNPMPAAAPAPAPSAAAPYPAPSALPASAPPVPVSPNPGFLQVPGSPAPPAGAPSVSVAGPVPPAIPSPAAAAPAPPTAPAPPASPSSGPQMTAAAKGVTYAAYQAAGWSDAQLIAAGLMTV